MRSIGSLREFLRDGSELSASFFWGRDVSVCFHDVSHVSCLGSPVSELWGRSVILLARDQYVTALALIELDGVARRLILCPPDLSQEQLSSVIVSGAAEAIVSDYPQLAARFTSLLQVSCHPETASIVDDRPDYYPTEWVLLTSGTTGRPKLVLHELSSLIAAIGDGDREDGTVWGTFYELCRYGGLQVLLRAVIGGFSLVIRGVEEPIADYLRRLSRHGVTHILGTPTHWRRTLMSPLASSIAPKYVRLSGEIADQSILNALQAFYPDAMVAHAFASTEAGVGFAVGDGLEGFPTSILCDSDSDVRFKVKDGLLHLCSAGNALRYIGDDVSAIRDADGYVNTGDVIEERGKRCYFLGRVSGVINVGGLKVYPEEVEAVINRCPGVRMSLVRARRNPITGSIAVADVMLDEEHDRDNISGAFAMRSKILKMCRAQLPEYKVPAAINIVSTLAVGPTGKLIRNGSRNV